MNITVPTFVSCRRGTNHQIWNGISTLVSFEDTYIELLAICAISLHSSVDCDGFPLSQILHCEGDSAPLSISPAMRSPTAKILHAVKRCSYNLHYSMRVVAARSSPST